MTKRELRRLEATAYHEAGHAVVAVMLDRGLRPVSIEASDDYRGLTQTGEMPETSSTNGMPAITTIQPCCGGWSVN